jgi:hypothetical protein
MPDDRKRNVIKGLGIGSANNAEPSSVAMTKAKCVLLTLWKLALLSELVNQNPIGVPSQGR